MTVLVLDASITVSWCFPERRTDLTTEVLREILEGFAVVPGLWALEVANALAAAERRSYLKPAQIAEFLRDLEELPKRVEQLAPERAFGRTFDLARSHELSTYDACYLELAERMKLPLATLDEDLQQAAEKEGVALLRAD